MAEPRVSIIIPVYNRRAYLEHALDSALAQTLENIEVICVDDGSTDGSLDILRAYEAAATCPFRVLETAHGGPGAARNAALDVAVGEYVCFLDSDDFLEPDALERAVGRASALEADLVVWDLWMHNDATGRDQLPLPGTVSLDAFVPRELQATTVFRASDNPDIAFGAFQNWVWNKLFRRSFIERAGLRFPEMHRTEDLPFTCMALAQAERIAVMHERFSHYRVGTRSSTMDTKDDHPLDFLEAFMLLRHRLEDAGLYETFRRGFARWALSGCIYNLNTLNERSTFELAYERLKDGGFAALDVSEETLEGCTNYYELDSWRALMQNDACGYLFWRSHILDEGLERERASLDEMRCDRDVQWTRAEAAERELGNAKLENASLAGDLAELRENFARMLASREYRAGVSLCKVPRAIQRRLRK